MDKYIIENEKSLLKGELKGYPVPGAEHKFDHNGKPLPFPGCSIISKIPLNSDLFYEIKLLQLKFKDLSPEKAYTYLPETSFHMTLFDCCNVNTVNTPYWPKNIVEDNNYTKIEFNAGIQEADYITIHIPLSDRTKNLISKKEFNKMKDNAIIVNTARGGIINEEDLFWALSNNKIYGAGTDVYEIEPPNINSPLFKLDNILFSPHNAALTLECRKRMAVETAENIIFYLEDHSKLNKQNIVNRKILDL